MVARQALQTSPTSSSAFQEYGASSSIHVARLAAMRHLAKRRRDGFDPVPESLCRTRIPRRYCAAHDRFRCCSIPIPSSGTTVRYGSSRLLVGLKLAAQGAYASLSPDWHAAILDRGRNDLSSPPMTVSGSRTVLPAAFASRVGSCSARVPAPPASPRTPFPLAIDVSPLPVPAPGAVCRLPVPLRVLGTYIIPYGRFTASPCRVGDLVLLSYGLLGA